MIHERKRVLVTVKAYPNPSKKYGETVCSAGVDLLSNQWIRLYPIPFRDLDDEQRFKKYNVIEVNCAKATDDHRPESYKVDAGSIKVIEWWDSKKDNWAKRKSAVLPLASPSLCQILQEAKEGKRSLGLFKPTDVTFEWKKGRPKDEESREACYAQLSFLNKAKDAIEDIPYEFYYSFKCFDRADCPSHKLSIIDWEIGQAFRNWRYKYKPDTVLLEKIRERWLDRMCLGEADPYFYVGNFHRFPETFMVLGTLYPRKTP